MTVLQIVLLTPAGPHVWVDQWAITRLSASHSRFPLPSRVCPTAVTCWLLGSLTPLEKGTEKASLDHPSIRRKRPPRPQTDRPCSPSSVSSGIVSDRGVPRRTSTPGLPPLAPRSAAAAAAATAAVGDARTPPRADAGDEPPPSAAWPGTRALAAPTRLGLLLELWRAAEADCTRSPWGPGADPPAAARRGDGWRPAAGPLPALALRLA